MAKVYAFKPRTVDPPHFVAETHEELAERVGEFIGGEQCDGCGNAVYRIEARDGNFHLPAVRLLAVCAVDPSDDPEFQNSDPCGTHYPITLWDENEVTF